MTRLSLLESIDAETGTAGVQLGDWEDHEGVATDMLGAGPMGLVEHPEAYYLWLPHGVDPYTYTGPFVLVESLPAMTVRRA
jgi:hypothetical protein